eukprot:9673577-Lingulodinium_polyedra.AAC.1
MAFRPEESGIDASDGDSTDHAGSECSLPAGPGLARRFERPPSDPAAIGDSNDPLLTQPQAVQHARSDRCGA